MTRPSRRELLFVAAAMAVGIAVRLLYVILTRDHTLVGDEVEYHATGRLFVEGHWFWGEGPYGIPHESLQKAPLYGVWVGVLYKILGTDPDKVFAVQALLAPLTIGLAWLIARRLFGVAAGLAAAGVMALYPNAWQFDVRLYSEALANPLTLLVLYLVLDRAPTTRRAALVGAVVGVALLVRPSSIFLLGAVAVAWWVASGLRRGAALTALTIAVAALVVAPWTLRNRSVDSDHLVPISIQDAAGYGTFNDDAANDPAYPYAWRPVPARDVDLFDKRRPLSDGDLRAKLNHRMREYIKDHPESVPKAFFWNGLTRLWDVRRPSHILDETGFEGRTRWLTGVGMVMYWVLLAFALARLWLGRSRRTVVLPVLALALAASVVYTPDAGTRYRAPVEGLVVALGCGGAAALLARRQRTTDA